MKCSFIIRPSCQQRADIGAVYIVSQNDFSAAFATCAIPSKLCDGGGEGSGDGGGGDGGGVGGGLGGGGGGFGIRSI